MSDLADLVPLFLLDLLLLLVAKVELGDLVGASVVSEALGALVLAALGAADSAGALVTGCH